LYGYSDKSHLPVYYSSAKEVQSSLYLVAKAYALNKVVKPLKQFYVIIYTK
jgi:hypothetical protein